MPSKTADQHNLMRACMGDQFRAHREAEGKPCPPKEVCREFLAKDKSEGKWQAREYRPSGRMKQR